MSNPSVTATIVFAAFALLFIGVLLTLSFVLDRRRVKEVHGYIPERSEGAFDHDTPSADENGRSDPDGDARDADEPPSRQRRHGAA